MSAVAWASAALAASWLGAGAPQAWAQASAAPAAPATLNTTVPDEDTNTVTRPGSPGQSPDPAALPATLASPDKLRVETRLSLPASGPLSKNLPVFFEADHMDGTPGIQTHATGAVRLKRGDLTMRADEVTHTQADDMARAKGHVKVTRRGDVFTGPELNLKLDTLFGDFLDTNYRFARTDAGGKATKIDFLGPNRLRAYNATYTSCTPDNTQDLSATVAASPAWVLTTSNVLLDTEADEGRAENAVVRFMGVPILASPVLTFPLSDARKSGFLPPNFDVDSKGGFEFAQPYYWNIAPERDATLTPTLSTRRGVGLDGEFRYLMTQDRGTLRANVLPGDRTADKDRALLDLQHQGNANSNDAARMVSYDLRVRRVSDDDYWKDFPRGLNNVSLTHRLLDSHLSVERQLNTRAWGLGPNQTTVYARIQSWQTLKDLDPKADASALIISPYKREPQIGLRSRSASDSGLIWGLSTEFNRFANEDAKRVTGNRLHALAQVERPFGGASWFVKPKFSVNAASYSLDNNMALTQAGIAGDKQRVIPTFSLDSGLVFERPVNLFGKSLVQTLEPRALYVRTPYRNQAGLPLFDSAPRDYNPYSIFSENAFTGVDRVSDANLLNLGLSTRFINPENGTEAMRLGIVQKVLFADQRITQDDGPPITQRLSDLLLLGSTSVIPNWSIDTTLQYGSQNGRIERSVLGTRYSPGPWRTVGMSYSYTRNSSQQMDLTWQWPLSGRTPPLTPDGQRSVSHAANQCGGAWYSVGKLSYSMRDRRLSNGLAGFEYDGGCWIGRVVAEQTAVGSSYSTRILFQLELIGLSRLGTSALKTMAAAIPGYRALRDEHNTLIPGASSDFHAYDD
jgi:LPS-assembly protein